MSVYQIKFKYQNVTRRISIAASGEGGLAMPVLATKAAQLYIDDEELIDASTLRFIYQDEDGDSVTITSQEELDEAVRILRATSQEGPLRFTLQAASARRTQQPPAAATSGAGASSPNSAKPCHGTPSASCQHAHHCMNVPTGSTALASHHGVECDGCGMTPILGTRYKCLVRDNYDLCATCEASKAGSELSFKIETPLESAFGQCGAMCPRAMARTGGGGCGEAGGEGGGGGRKQWLRRMMHGGAPGYEQHGRTHTHGHVYGHGRHHAHGHGHGHQGGAAPVPPPGSDSDQQHHGRRGGCRGGGGGGGGRFIHQMFNAFGQHAGTVSELKAELERSFSKAAAASAASAGSSDGTSPQQPRHAAPWLPWMQAASDVVAAVSGAAEKMSNAGSHPQGDARTVDEDTAADESILQDVLKMSMQGQGAPPTTATPAAGGDGNTASAPAATAEQLRAELERNFATHACHASAPELKLELERAFGIHAPMSTVAKLQAELLRAAGGGECPDEDDDAEDVRMNVNSAAPPRLMCRYVRDLTYPDGTEVLPGSQFFKTWRIRNDGQTDWPEGCALQFSGGDDLTYICNDITLAKVAQEIDVSVALIAPDAEGRYTIYFRVSAPDGKLFGQRFWADVRVVPPVNDHDPGAV